MWIREAVSSGERFVHRDYWCTIYHEYYLMEGIDHEKYIVENGNEDVVAFKCLEDAIDFVEGNGYVA